MSRELRLLLERTRVVASPSPSTEPPKTSQALMLLLTRTENRKWREEMIQRVLKALEELADELTFIDHVRNCTQCQFELVIDVERYNGHVSPWYLNVENEVGWPEIYEESELYKDCPRLWNYKIGSYWTGTSADTIRFIKDRMAWAEGKIREYGKALAVFLEELESWNLNDDSVPVLEDSELSNLLL